jgi:hypothetical protein
VIWGRKGGGFGGLGEIRRKSAEIDGGRCEIWWKREVGEIRKKIKRKGLL